jgi:ketosteroid isomerase-like protein
MSDTRGTVNEFFLRLGAMDAEGLAALFAETIDWYVPGATNLPWTGHRTRRGDVPDYFRTLWSHLHLEMSQAKLDQLIIEGDDAIALGTFSHVAKTTERPFSTPFALHLKIQDGSITLLQLYEDTYVVGKAFGV